MVFLVTNDADPGFGMDSADHMTVEPFFVTPNLQGRLRTNQQFPRVATQRSSAKLSVSDQRVQRTGAPVDYNETDLLTDLHAEADLGEGCVPVGGQFGLLGVKSGLPSIKVKSFVVPPEGGIVMKGLLWKKKHSSMAFACKYISS